MENLHNLLNVITEAAIILFDYAGVFILIVSGIHGMIDYVTKKPFTRLNLAKGMIMSLNFKLGGEILRTVTVHNFSEIRMVAGIILLRAALTLILHFEIKHEEKHQEHN